MAIDLDRLRELCEAATPGEWKSSREDMDSFTMNRDMNKPETQIVAYVYRDPEHRIPVFGEQFRNDSRFIAASRAALPELLRRLSVFEKLFAEMKPGDFMAQRDIDAFRDLASGKGE